MKKIKFETKQDYLNYCDTHAIVSECSGEDYTWLTIIDSHERKNMFKKASKIEPKSYPCILCYEEFADNYIGAFVYPNDF